MTEALSWQNRPLEPMYPVVFFDGISGNSPVPKDIFFEASVMLPYRKPDRLLIFRGSQSPFSENLR